ncbi:MAG: DUF3365 domain-containing protein [Gemmataceae bacterium]|nr:DUF3365 domain-containing protein [Gemmataceae bacterium]MDW8244392.1 DUF3365 domain-containing protein [Thermogemmata sp.]
MGARYIATAVAVSGLVLGSGGCNGRPQPVESGQRDRAVQPLTEAELSEQQKQQRDKAVAAREALFNALMSRLSEVMTAQGPAAAVEVCQAEAPRIAQAKAQELGVRIGRTSDRLRNPNNKPPSWAETVLVSRPEHPVYYPLPDGHLGVLLPIRLKQQCLTCHGPPEQIPAAVRERLARFYPEDRATGYAENDLRGWFWIEVPPTGS